MILRAHGWTILAIVMVVVADISVLRHCNLRLHRLAGPLFIAILIGTAIPTFIFLGPILSRPHLLDAQYAIPFAGMLLGNCLCTHVIHLEQQTGLFVLCKGHAITATR